MLVLAEEGEQCNMQPEQPYLLARSRAMEQRDGTMVKDLPDKVVRALEAFQETLERRHQAS